MPKGGYQITVTPTITPNEAHDKEATQYSAEPSTIRKSKSFKRPALILALLAAIPALYIGVSALSKLSPNVSSQAEVEPVQSPLNQQIVSVSSYPKIAVRPFTNETGNAEYDFLEDRLQSMLVQDLTHFPLVRPVRYDEVYETLPKDGEVNDGPYSYAISGKMISVEPELSLSIKLVDLADGSILFEKEIKRSPGSSGYSDELSKIATELSGDFAGLGGVIPQESVKQIEAGFSDGTMSLSDLNQYQCLLLTDKFQYDPQKTPAKFKAAYTCLNANLGDNPDDPLLLANLGSMTIWATKSDPKFHRAQDLNPDINPADGLEMVKRAADLAPDIGNVQYLYSSTLMANGGSVDDALKHAELARKPIPETRFTWLGLATFLPMLVTGTEPYHCRRKRASAPRL